MLWRVFKFIELNTEVWRQGVSFDSLDVRSERRDGETESFFGSLDVRIEHGGSEAWSFLF